MRKPDIRVGCCGFPVARATYFALFPVVEIQQTFYQPPTRETAERWREEAPPEFEFVIKAWQLITHEPTSPTYRRLRMPLGEAEKRQAGGFRWTGLVRQAWETICEVALVLQAQKVLFQCPASFAPTAENRERMRHFFRSIDRRGLTCIWEPRGNWQSPAIDELCYELDLVHCVDPFQSEPVTTGVRYYRLHGISGYRHEYSDEELKRLVGWCAPEAVNYVLFNNVNMFRDATRFQGMVQ